MSEIAVPVTAPAVIFPRLRVLTLTRVRYFGYALLGLQLIGFMTWSAILYNRYCLTYDFSLYHQAWFEIAHGNLNPYDSAQRFPFWRNHFELVFWALAPLYWVWPHDLMLPWVQDLAVVGAQAVAFTWICELAAKRRERRDMTWLAIAGFVLLVANPWVWQTVSWDYHTEPLTTLFLILLLRDLANGRRRAWVWVPPMLLCGDVAATYLIGAGIGTALARRRSRVRGLAVAGVGVAAFLFIAVIHGDVGSGQGFKMYAYLAGGTVSSSITVGVLLKGIVTHPWVSVRTLAAKSADIWANLAPSGLLGAFFVALLPVTVVVLLANDLWPSLLFAAPGFQNVPLYLLLPVGTVGVLAALHGRIPGVARLLSCLVVVQALVWTAVWAPGIPGQWLRVPAGTAATLAATAALIPAGAEVVASQGVVGRLAARADDQPVMSPGLVPVHGETWFVVVPTEGIETESTASAMAFIGELAGPLGATLVTHANGVWAFRWQAPPGVMYVTVPGDTSPLEAWVSAGAAGRAVLSGPVSGWHAESTGAQGYVTDQLAWQVPTGRYVANVSMLTSGPVNVEVWDDTGNVLLARRTVAASAGIEQVTIPVPALTAFHASNPWGWGPFHADFLSPPPGQRLEVRVWSPGNTLVSVYSADLTPAPSALTTRAAPNPAGPLLHRVSHFVPVFPST